jgi:endonuclease YncB( thermonuclease family)
LLDLFLIAGAALGLIALLAFTPGDGLERFVRPVILLLMGFMIGGVAALAVVATGLGGQVRPRTYLGFVEAEDIYDGDTFQMGEVSLRLWGVDAPELHQECRSVTDCGLQARAHLVALTSDALLQCDQKQSMRSHRLVESFGRPLVRCWVRRSGQAPFDLAAQMIRDGYAVQYRADTSFGYSQAEAEGRSQGLMRGCMLRPDFWRNDNAARRAFETHRALPEGAVTIGLCPVLEQPL